MIQHTTHINLSIFASFTSYPTSMIENSEHWSTALHITPLRSSSLFATLYSELINFTERNRQNLPFAFIWKTKWQSHFPALWATEQFWTISFVERSVFSTKSRGLFTWLPCLRYLWAHLSPALLSLSGQGFPPPREISPHSDWSHPPSPCTATAAAKYLAFVAKSLICFLRKCNKLDPNRSNFGPNSRLKQERYNL